MRNGILFAVCLGGVLFVVTGCSTNQWARGFEPVGEVRYPAVERTTITFEQVPYPDLERDRDLPGFQVIGVSQFRGPIQKARPSSPDSDLRKHAARVGADHVRWAELPIGTVGYVHEGTGHVVTRTDYLAVYYRRAKRHEDHEDHGQ